MVALSDDQFGKIHSKLAGEGGFTVNPHTGEDITSGISVAPRGNERQVPVGESTPASLQSYHAENAPRFGSGPRAPGAPRGVHDPRNASLGGWRSEDTDFFDTPTVYRNTPSGQSGARKQMVLSGQEAAFHLDSFQELPNPFHAEGRRKFGMEQHELAVTGRSREAADWAMKQPEVQAWVNAPRGAPRGRRSGG